MQYKYIALRSMHYIVLWSENYTEVYNELAMASAACYLQTRALTVHLNFSCRSGTYMFLNAVVIGVP